MNATVNQPIRAPLLSEESKRKIKIALIVPAGVICCAVMFIAS